MEVDTPDEEFSAYVEARRRSLMRTAFLLTGEHHTAEDLVQSALARVYVAWRRIRRPDAIDAYVRKTLLNEYFGWWRRAWRRREHATGQVPEVARPSDDTTSEQDERLWNAVQDLAPRQRAVIVLRYFEDLRETEIADLLGCSPGTVKSTAHRSLTKLRESLGSQAPLSGELVTKEHA